ncbi:MAG: hypothetical protein WCE64_10910, partial [Bacteroidales bacterium]
MTNLRNRNLFKLFFLSSLLLGIFKISLGFANSRCKLNSISEVDSQLYVNGRLTNSQTESLDALNSCYQKFLSLEDTAKSQLIIFKIIKCIESVTEENLILSNSLFYVGHFYATQGNYSEALRWLIKSQSIRDKLNCFDETYCKCLYSASVAYFNLGDFKNMESITLKCIDKLTVNQPSLILFKCYSNLVTAYFGLNEYSKAIDNGITAL